MKIVLFRHFKTGKDRLVVATSFGAWVEARTAPEGKRSRSEMQRRIVEKAVRWREAVERKCALMLSSHEAREQTALLVEGPSRRRQIMANIFNPFQEILVQP